MDSAWPPWLERAAWELPPCQSRAACPLQLTGGFCGAQGGVLGLPPLVNLCLPISALSPFLLPQVQFEAKHSMDVLDDKTVDGFQLLLMTTKPLLRTFDHVF